VKQQSPLGIARRSSLHSTSAGLFLFPFSYRLALVAPVGATPPISSALAERCQLQPHFPFRLNTTQRCFPGFCFVWRSTSQLAPTSSPQWQPCAHRAHLPAIAQTRCINLHISAPSLSLVQHVAMEAPQLWLGNASPDGGESAEC
jgi:hypothetical protein